MTTLILQFTGTILTARLAKTLQKDVERELADGTDPQKVILPNGLTKYVIPPGLRAASIGERFSRDADIIASVCAVAGAAVPASLLFGGPALPIVALLAIVMPFLGYALGQVIPPTQYRRLTKVGVSPTGLLVVLVCGVGLYMVSTGHLSPDSTPKVPSAR